MGGHRSWSHTHVLSNVSGYIVSTLRQIDPLCGLPINRRTHACHAILYTKILYVLEFILSKYSQFQPCSSSLESSCCSTIFCSAGVGNYNMKNEAVLLSGTERQSWALNQIYYVLRAKDSAIFDFVICIMFSFPL